jgi:zinc transport system substrate-binding protein
VRCPHVLLSVGLFALLVTGCVSRRQQPAGRLTVFVSILPLKQLVERVVRERVEVHALVGPGQSPHSYAPTPVQMARLAEARLFFRVGVEFEESLIPKIESSMQRLRIVDLRQGVALRRMEEIGEGSPGHDHAADVTEHGHAHDGADPHVWMSPVNAAVMARTVSAALSEADPAGRPVYAANCSTLTATLDSLHAELAAALRPYAGRVFYVFHASFGYFADAYGLRQIPVEVGGKEPSARQLARLIDRARADSVRVVFVQPEFSDRSARALAEQLHGSVAAIDPLAEDYVGGLMQIQRAISAGFAR